MQALRTSRSGGTRQGGAGHARADHEPAVRALASGRSTPGRSGGVVRDALLGGCEPAPGDFDDARFVDLLAENHGPVWLACLGALRHLWPVPPADWSELAPSVADSQDDDERGQPVLGCLRRSRLLRRDDPAAVAARKRMKQLDADMHALLHARRSTVGSEAGAPRDSRRFQVCAASATLRAAAWSAGHSAIY